MPFLHPILLWGLAFVAVPILLTLLMNRKKLVLRWAAYEWMRRAIITRKKRIKLDEILKLIAKILLITAIVLAIVRPFVRFKGAEGNTLVVVDNSPSMGVACEDGTRLDKARKLVGAFLGAGDETVALYTFDGKFEPVIAKPSNDRRAVQNALNTLGPGASCSGAESFFAGLKALPCLPEVRNILFVGDFQSCWYGDGAKIADDLRPLGRAYPMVWHQVDFRPDLQNVAVEKLSISPDGLFLGRECFVTVRLLNGSGQRTGDRTVSLLVDGERVAQAVVRLDPDERRELSFVALFNSPGWHRMTARLDPDAYPADDVQHATLRVPPALRVLAIVPDKAEAPFPFDTYLKASLQGLLPAQGLVYQSVSPVEFMSMNPAAFDVIVTLKLGFPAESPLAEKLTTFARKGGGWVAFLPADDPREAAALGIEAEVAKEPGSVKDQSLEGSFLDFMKAPDLKPGNIAFQKSLVFKNVKEGAARLTIQAGVNALSLPMEKGRLALFGFVPYHGYTDLHYNPNFVQMMLRAFSEARAAPVFCSRKGELGEWAEPNLNRDAAYTLHDEKGTPWNLVVDGLGESTRLILPRDPGYGFFTIRENGQDKAHLACNVDTADSRLGQITAAQLKSATEQGLTFSAGEAISGVISRMDLSLLTMVLLLGAVAFEAYAHFFRYRK